MKHTLSISLLLLLFCANSFAQSKIEVAYPDIDIVRLQTPSDREESVSPPDTTNIPFWEDFTDPLVPMKQVANVSGAPVKITTYGLHGLQSGDQITVFNVPNTQYTGLNGNFYVKVVDPFAFKLYTTPAMAASDSLDGNGITITYLLWAKMPYDRISLVVPPSPNPLKWMPNEGTYINDRYPIEPISYNVATFDGLNYLGVQYNTGNFFKNQGYADNLTSIPIDLSGLIANDSVYLSFYWQIAGVGDSPEPDDYFALEFKDNTDTWVEVWRMSDNSSTPISNQHFFRANVAVIDPIYLYKGFQFRFRNHGRLSGPFDVWNLDGIYLDKNRQANDVIKDWAISRGQHSFLKKYTAMPYDDFFNDISNQVWAKDSIITINTGTYNNSLTAYVKLYDNVNGVNNYISVNTNSVVLSTGTYSYKDMGSFDMDFSTLVNTNIPRCIKQYYLFSQVDTTSIFLGNNNYYSTETILWDYYAYDDGTPEYGLKTTQSGVDIGNQYIAGINGGILTDIDICFTRDAGIDMAGRTIFLSVWDDASGFPNAALVTQGIQIAYPTPFYGFTRYHLLNPVTLSPGQVYYVGYTQNISDPVFVGLDASIDNSDKIFHRDFSTWTCYKGELGYVPGSYMIRPVFSKGETLVPVVDPAANNSSAVMYPNPADDILYIEGDISEVVITDLLGRTVLTYKSNEGGKIQQHQLNTSSLTEGLYLVRMISSNGAAKTEKLLVR